MGRCSARIGKKSADWIAETRICPRNRALSLTDIELSHPFPEVAFGNVQHASRYGLIVSGFLPRLFDKVFPGLLHSFGQRVESFLRADAFDDGRRQVIEPADVG